MHSNSAFTEIIKLFLLLSFVSLGFFGYGALQNSSLLHWYLLWNLVLAWIPFVLSLLLYKLLRTQSWANWLPLGLTLLWLSFLPNTFYILTDFIHLFDTQRVDPVFDVLIFSSFITVGVLLGYVSLGLVHLQMIKRMGTVMAWRMVGIILFATSFAIYVGRELRWNTWDIVTNPAGILFDISERIIHPFAHPKTYVTTLSFFVFLSVGYYCAYKAANMLRRLP